MVLSPFYWHWLVHFLGMCAMLAHTEGACRRVAGVAVVAPLRTGRVCARAGVAGRGKLPVRVGCLACILSLAAPSLEPAGCGGHFYT